MKKRYMYMCTIEQFCLYILYFIHVGNERPYANGWTTWGLL